MPDGIRLKTPPESTAVGLAFWLPTLAILAALRVPYLRSPLYVLDNDEAVLGIMARRLSAGTEWPLLFAGQSYGLAIFETGPAALAFAIFGDSAAVLTGTVLALFLLGTVLYARALGLIAGSAGWGRALAVVVALLPGWIVWSTKARGLYVGGFVLAALLLELLSRSWTSRPWAPVGAGLLLGVLALVQPLWLLVPLPLVVDRLGWARGMKAVALGFVLWLAPTWALAGRDAFWQPEFLGPDRGGLRTALIGLGRAFSGRVVPAEPGWIPSVVGVLGVVVYVAVLAVVAFEATRRRSRLLGTLTAALALGTAHVFVLQFWVPRYFLPAVALLGVAIAALLGARSVRFTHAAAVSVGAVSLVLALGAFQLGHPVEGSILGEVSAREDLSILLAGLEGDEVEAVYAASSDIQWQLLFYGGPFPVRGRSAGDRYPELAAEVEAVRRAGGRTALVADVRRLRDELGAIGGFPGYRVGERYLRLDRPSEVELRLLGFEGIER